MGWLRQALLAEVSRTQSFSYLRLFARLRPEEAEAERGGEHVRTEADIYDQPQTVQENVSFEVFSVAGTSGRLTNIWFRRLAQADMATATGYIWWSIHPACDAGSYASRSRDHGIGMATRRGHDNVEPDSKVIQRLLEFNFGRTGSDAVRRERHIDSGVEDRARTGMKSEWFSSSERCSGRRVA